MNKAERKAGKRRWDFVKGLGVPVIALGAAAILGAEPEHLAVARILGLLLLLAGLGGLAAWQAMRAPRSRAVLVWALVAVAAGVAIEIKPAHGLPSLGVLAGLLFIGHGGAAFAIAFRRWPARDRLTLGVLVAASLFALVGLALLLGGLPGERAEEALIGVDMVAFGLYLLVGHELLEGSGPPPPSRSPRTPSR